MITATLLNLVYYLLYALAYVFLLAPDVVANPAFASSMQTAVSYAQAINSFFPVSELLFTIAGIFLLYEGGYLALKVFNWVIRKFPGIS